MSATTWVPPGRMYHLRIFAVALTIILLSLIGLLFGVYMEALEPAKGMVTSKHLHEVRASLGGLIEPGWYEGKIGDYQVRVDSQGNGLTGAGEAIHNQRLPDGQVLSLDALTFHRLQAGDELWPGQILAEVRADALRFRLRELENQSDGSAAQQRAAGHEKSWLEFQLEQAALRVPRKHERWQVLEVPVSKGQAIKPGALIARVVPIDPKTRVPVGLMARLDLDERGFGSAKPGQLVRVHSNVFNHRVHGQAHARIHYVEPWGEALPDGKRQYHADAEITEAPFTLPLGSTFDAEVVVGRKSVYRIILEH